MQLPSSSEIDQHHDATCDIPPGRSAIRPTTARLIRFILYALSSLGGAATGTSAMTLLLYQPTDWRWAWLGAGGLLAGACAVALIAYFPRNEGPAQ